MDNYPDGVTGKEPQISGPTPDEEKISFLEDFVERTEKVLDEVYSLCKEYEIELDYKASDDDDGFDIAIGGLELIKSDFEAHIARLESDEYDDPRL
jgi:hypothetical protein